MSVRFLPAFLGLLLVWPTSIRAADSSEKAPPNESAILAKTVLMKHCYRCHKGEGSEGGDFDVSKPETLRAPRDKEDPYVVAGKPDKSFLFERMAKGTMPPKKEPSRPTPEEQALVKKWIEGGAPNFPGNVARKYISTIEMLTAIRDDLNKAERNQVRFLRYFTLTHHHNNATISDQEMQVYRAALSKTINSLSWGRNIVIPRAVDAAQTVFAIDIREVSWDRGDLWNEVMAAYPYGLKFDRHPDPVLQKLDIEIDRVSQCELVHVRADWFVATATRPPLYHLMLQIPKHARELEKRLDVDVQQNFINDRAMRAGFAKSGVSGQNRLLERHETPYGAYWKSYDFKAGKERSSLIKFPLGPVFEKNRYGAFAFDHDGGEMVFHLPNGLQGYMLVDGKDNRIDEGPTEVVSDSQKTSGTAAIVNGTSCIACHTTGMKPFKDDIREGTSLAGDAREKVRQLYPKDETFKAIVAKDEEQFLAAAEKATGIYLKIGADKDKSFRQFDEPIGIVSRKYRLDAVDLATASNELGYEKVEEFKAVLNGNRRLRELGLAPLIQENGAIQRHEWEAIKGNSLFQKVAQSIERGTPFRYIK